MDINRKTAYRTLLEIEKNQAYSNLELNKQIEENSPDSPAFVRELVYGVLENKIYLDYLLAKLIPKGLRGIKKPVLTLLRMGLYQMIFMDSVPAYAAVSETVRMAKRLTPGREGFVNGVLRGYSKKGGEISLPDRGEDPAEYLSVRYSYAKWIVRLWMNQYGEEQAEALLAAGNRRPKLSIRVNLLKTDRENLARVLSEKGFEVSKGSLSERILFVKGSGLLETEEYQNGLFSVQDQASAFTAEVLNPMPGDTVLDICAAPGGKSLAISELMENTGIVKSFDIYRHKLALLEKEADRLGISIITAEENDGCAVREDLLETADRVLVDGPCSGLGVTSRKPEIKYRELGDDGRQLAEKQLRILSVSAGYLKKGGTLVYSTCTVNKLENTEVVKGFLMENPDFELVCQRQLLPGAEETDGFYICKMKKK